MVHHSDGEARVLGVVDEHSDDVVEGGTRDTEQEGILDAAVVGETAAHEEEVVQDSCTVAARRDLPGLEAVHVHRTA